MLPPPFPVLSRSNSHAKQKEDAGHLSLAGFSAGARSNPQFHWARNLIRKLSPEAALSFRQRQSSAFALF